MSDVPKIEALADALADRLAPVLADRVADRLATANGSEGLVDAREIARRFAISRETVYARADELGAIRIGDGERPRLRFDPARVAEALTARPHPLTDPTPERARPRPRRRKPNRDLLPIKEESKATQPPSKPRRATKRRKAA